MLEDLAPLDKHVAYGLAGGEPGRLARAGAVTVWLVAADEAIVVSPPDRAAEAAAVVAGARAVVDVSSGYAALRLAGAEARSVLASACPVDLGEAVVPDGAIVQAAVANVRVILARTDAAGATAFTLLVARDEARYLWDALVSLGATPGAARGGRP